MGALSNQVFSAHKGHFSISAGALSGFLALIGSRYSVVRPRENRTCLEKEIPIFGPHKLGLTVFHILLAKKQNRKQTPYEPFHCEKRQKRAEQSLY